MWSILPSRRPSETLTISDSLDPFIGPLGATNLLDCRLDCLIQEWLIYGCLQLIFVAIIDGAGFSLPIANVSERVDVSIDVSDAARAAVKSAIGDQMDTHVLIISAKAGGCSGYLYDMVITERPNENGFQVIDVDGVTILIHDDDSALLNGLKLDFKDSLMGGGFHMDNPNADRACGCGQSFG